MLSAGSGPDVLLCLHGLGGTKASFLPTVAALADRYRVVAMDLPGFGESDKPIGAPYDSEWFARSAVRRPRRARGRRGPRGRQQHGRPRRDRGRPDGPLARAVAVPAEPRAGLVARPPLGARRAAAAPGARPAAGGAALGDRPHSAHAGARRQRRLGRGRRGRVPSRLSHPARARRLLRRRPQHLPRRAARRRRLLDPPGRPLDGRAVRLGPPRHARADRLHEARGARAARRRATWSSTAATCRSSSVRARRTPRCSISCAGAERGPHASVTP